jgi:hypothetical protein
MGWIRASSFFPLPEKIKRAAEKTTIKKRRRAIKPEESARNANTSLVMFSPVPILENKKGLLS